MKNWFSKILKRTAPSNRDSNSAPDHHAYIPPKFNAELLEPRLLLSADPLLLGQAVTSLQDDNYENPAIIIELPKQQSIDDIQTKNTPDIQPLFQLTQDDLGEYIVVNNTDNQQPEEVAVDFQEVVARGISLEEKPFIVSDDSDFETVNFVVNDTQTERLVETLLAANPPPTSDLTDAPRILRPGNSPGIENHTDYNLLPDDTLEIEVGGYTPGQGNPVVNNGYDQINVSNEASLDGTLQIVLINNFVPNLGDTFDFLTFGTLTGEFATVTGPYGFGPGNLYFEVVEQSDRLQLVVAEIPTGLDLHTTTAATDRMHEALGALADQADQLLSDLILGDANFNGTKIPGTNVSLDELFDLTDYLDIGPTLDAYLAPMLVLGSEVDFEIEEFLNTLRSGWLNDLLGGNAFSVAFDEMTYTGGYDTITGIEVKFDGSANFDQVVPVGIAEAVEGVGPAFADIEVSLDITFAFTLTLDWASTGAEAGYAVTQFNLDASENFSNLVVPMTIGDLEASAGHPQQTPGTFDLEVHLDLIYDDVMDEYLVNYDPGGDPASSVDLDVIIYASLAGVDVNQGPDGTIRIAGDLFLVADGGQGTAPVATTSANLENFTPFTNLLLTDIKANLEAMRDDWLATVENSDRFNVEIPLIDATLADVPDLGSAFDLAVLSKLDFDSMGSLQDFVAAVTLAGLLPDGEAVTYNTTDHILTIPLDFEIDLGGLSLRDLDVLGQINLQLLENEGLIQIGAYIDPDDLLDSTSYATLASLFAAGVFNASSVDNWDDIDTDTVIQAGLIGAAALDMLGLIDGGNVDLDEIIDLGLVTFGELVQAEVVTAGSLVGNLGFVRDLNAMATNLADMGLDLASQATLEDLVSLDDILDNSLATLEEIFDLGLADLGDINLDTLGINEIISSGIASLQNLVDQGLVEASDFVSSTLVNITSLINDTAADLSGLITEGLIGAADFVSATLIDAADFFTAGLAPLTDIVDEALVTVTDFTDLALPAADLIADGLATAFELDFNDLVDGLNVSLHELVLAGVVTLAELVQNGDVAVGDLVTDYAFQLADLIEANITDTAELVTGALMDLDNLATTSLDLERILNSGLVSLNDLVNNALLDLQNLILEEINVPGLIESGLADLGDLARENFLTPVQMAIDEFLQSDIATQASSLMTDITNHGGLIGSGSIIDLDDLLNNLPVELYHLVYFGLIDHNDVRPLGTVDAIDLKASKVIDSSQLNQNSIAEVVASGYLTIGDLIDLAQLVRADLADLPLADLDLFGFSESVVQDLNFLALVQHGDTIPIANLLSETDVTMYDLLQFGIIAESDLVADLSNALLDDVFVQGTADRGDLLASDILEGALVQGYASQNPQGDYVVTVADLIDNSLATLADLVKYGLLNRYDFDLTTVTITETEVLSWGIVPPNKLDNNNLVQDGSPDFVNADELIELGLVTLEEMAGHLTAAQLQINVTELRQTAIFATDVLGINFLRDNGLTDDDIDLEALFDTGKVSEGDLVGVLVNATDFWRDNVVTLSQLVDALLVDQADLATDTTVNLAVLLDSDVVSEKYIADENLDPDDDDFVLIEDLLLDTYSTFAAMVKAGLLRGEDFINKIFGQVALEAIEVMKGEPLSLQPLFADGQLDHIVHVGSVGVDVLLGSILYDVTLNEYISAGFVDVFDFVNIDLTVADLEAEFTVDIDDSYVTTIPLYSLVALGLPEITLSLLISEGYVTDGNLSVPVVELDIRDLESSSLFEVGDLNNYISSYDVYLLDLIEEVYIGDLVDLGELDVNDLIIRNFGLLADLVEEGILDKDSFVDSTLSAANLDTLGLVSIGDLNAFNLVDGDDVSLQMLLLSRLVSLEQLIAGGAVDESDLGNSVLAESLERIHRSDIFDKALIEFHSLVTGAENDEVILTDSTDPGLLSTNIATLVELVKEKVVTPAHLADGATVDKDDLIDEDLAELLELMAAGLIATADLTVSAFDIEELDTTGVLPIEDLNSLDLIIALGLVTATEVDGLTVLDAGDLVASGLVIEDDLVDNGLFGIHVDLAALMASGLVTIDELKDEGLDERSGRVELVGLLDAIPTLVTLADLQTAGVVSENVEIDMLLESGLVTLLDLVEGGVRKADLLATTFPGSVTISELQLVSAGLFDPDVDLVDLLASELVTITALEGAGLVSDTIDLEELLLLNLVTGQQLVDAGIITQGQLDTEDFVGDYLVALLTTDVTFEDGTGTLITAADLAAYGFFAADIVRADLIASGLVDDTQLNDNGFSGVDPINPRLLIASGLVTPEELGENELIGAVVDKDALIGAGIGVSSEAELVDAGLLLEWLDADDIAAEGWVTLTDIQNEGLIVNPLIARSDLDALGMVDYDSLDLGLLDILRLLDSGLVDDEDQVDLDDLMDENVPALGEPMFDLAELVRLGLIDEKDMDGHNLDLFGLTGHTITLEGDYGLSLVGLISDRQAELEASVSGSFDLLADIDGSELVLSWKDFSLTATVGFDVTDLDVPARLGFIGVVLGNVSGAENLVHVLVSRTVIIDEDGNLGTTADRTFTTDEILADTFDELVSEDLSGEATAELGGITVNTGLGGLGVAHGAVISFTVEDLSRSKSDSDYITLEMNDVPGMFRVYEFLRLDDLMSALLRGRNYVMEALDQLPFWVLDPNNPLYETLSDVTIPVINKTPQELLEFIGNIGDAVDKVQQTLQNPDNDLQALIRFIMDKLGLDFELDSEIFSVGIEAGVLVMSLKLDEEFSEDIPFDFDLAAFAGLVGGIPGIEGIDDLIAMDGSGIISVKAFAEVQIKAGIDASGRNGGSPVDVFLFDWDDGLQAGTRVAAGFKILAQDISLGFEVFDSIGLRTNDTGLDWDRDGVGGLDGTLYKTDATIDADGDATTNPELGNPSDRSDFVTVAFVLDQQNETEVPDDGLYRFNETLIGTNVVFTGVDGGLELFMPLTIDVFGTEIDMTTPLWIRTNPLYDTDPNEGLEQIFRHLFGASPGPHEPVIIVAPDIVAELGNLVDSVIKGLLEDLAGLIGELKDMFLSTDFLNLEIPGTGRTIQSFIDGASSGNNGLAGVVTATGLEAFLDVDTYVFAYLETINWVGTNSVADGSVSVGDIWTGLGTFLRDHWMPTLPGIGGQGNPSFFTVDSLGDELNIAVNIPYTISDTIPVALTTDLEAAGLEFDAALDFTFDIATGLAFDFTVDLLGENSSFNFEEFYLSASVSANDIDLGISYEMIELTTHVGSDFGDIDLSIGGSIYLQDGSFVFDHESNKDDTVIFDNSVSIYLPLTLVIGGGGLELGSIAFADTDFYDGVLDPGFSVDLQDIGGLLEEAAFLIMDLLGETINDLKGDLVPVYDP
ncbi:MAG: LEPR-XLL domain-containing protein, partial [Planctomycetes bacterium]|nr:LEPR-XLL domain-containing protein [Planctomycetota bacterium]